MDIPQFDEVFGQIKINFWLIGVPFDQRAINLRYFVLLVIINIMIIEEVAFFYSKFSAENFLQLTYLAPCTAIGVLSVIKIVLIMSKRRNIFELTPRLQRLYEEMLNDSKKRELIRGDFKFLKYFVKYFFVLNLVLITVYNFTTLVLMSYHYYTKRVIVYSLPYPVLVPFSTDTWQTWLLVYIHSAICGYICVLYYTTVDALYYTTTTHICAQFTQLSDEIQCLDKSTAHCLGEIVKKHQYILKLSEDLEQIFSAANLFNVLAGSIVICSLGFNLTIGAWTQMPGVILFLLSALTQMLMISVYGENLIKESRRVGEAAFMCKWYDMDEIAKKIIFMLIQRSNRPQKLTTYKFSVISNQSFTKIISTSWSYFTILKTVYTPPYIFEDAQ